MKDFLLLKNFPALLIQDILLLLLPIVLLINIFLLQERTAQLEDEIQKKSFPIPAKIEFSAAPYPIIGSYSFQLTGDSPSIVTGAAAIVMDNDSQVILFSKNPTLVFPMASTTKIMTALVALEFYAPENILTIYDDKVDGAVIGFKKGQQFYFKDLLYAMLLPSGNDAALAIAQSYPGGKEAFVKRMNEKVKQLYLNSTSFYDPTGLSEKNQTTAYDLAKLSSVAIKNDRFAEVVKTKHYTISDVARKDTYALTNLNRLLGIEGVNGIKTGFTEEAGEVLVTSRVVEGKTIIAVVMKSKSRFLDTQTLLSLINKNISYLEVESLLKD